MQNNRCSGDSTWPIVVACVLVCYDLPGLPFETMTTHSVSVVVPTYNGAPFLLDALNSINRQTRLPCEVVIVDDCSTDASCSIVENWIAENSTPYPVVTLKTERNSGSPARPLNIGVGAAIGQLIAILEQDDIFVPHKLAHCVSAFEKNLELSFVVHGAQRRGATNGYGSIALRNFETDPLVSYALSRGGAEFIINTPTATLLAVKHSMFATGFPGMVFRKSAWEKAGRLPEHYRVATDYAFLLALARGGIGSYLPERLYERRSHGSCLSHNSSQSFLEVLCILKAKIEAEPEILQIRGITEAIIWRTIESAWNIAAFGYHRQAYQIISMATKVGGWSMRRELQKHATWLMPAYRAMFMPSAVSSEDAANAIVRTAESLLKLASDR